MHNNKKSNYKIIYMGFIVYIILLFICYFFTYPFQIEFVKKSNEVNYQVASSDIEKGAKDFLYNEKENKIQLTSKSKDSWVEIKINESMKYAYISIYISNLKRNNDKIHSSNFQVYYALNSAYTSAKCSTLKLKVGHNLIKVPVNNENNTFRLDFVDEKNIEITIDKINITNSFKFSWIMPILLKAFMIEIFLLILFLTENKYTKLQKVRDKTVLIIQKFFLPYKKFMDEFKIYLSENKLLILIIIFLTFVSYGILFTYYTIYIDEERQIIESYATLDWVAQGRFGNYLFEKYLLTGKIFTSFLGDLLAASLLSLASIIQSYNITKMRGNSNGIIAKVLYCGLAISVPYVCGAYMIVGIYNIEIGLALCLVALVIALILGENNFSLYNFLHLSICLTIAISIYQAFVPLFITGVVLCLFTYINFHEGKIDHKIIINKIIISAFLCLISICSYYILNTLFIKLTGVESNYLSNSFIGWGNGESFYSILKSVLWGIYKIYVGASDMLLGGVIFRITSIVFILYSLLKIMLLKDNRIIFIFLACSSIIAPFMLNIAFGTTNFAGRTLLGLPYLIGTIWFIIVEKFSRRCITKFATCFVASYLLFTQIQLINQYFLSDFKRYQIDVNITQEIISDIRKETNGKMNIPIVPVGTYFHGDNGLTMTYESAGSYFTVDGGAIARIIRFIQAQGYEIMMPTPEQITDSYMHISNMPSWPQNGSVLYVNGYAIVKLSEPDTNWYNFNVLPEDGL